MRTLIVNPPRCNGLPVVREDRCEIVERRSLLPSVSLQMLAGALKKEDEVSYIDANGFCIGYGPIAQRLRRERFDRLIFRFTPQTLRHDMRLAYLCRRVSPKTRIEAICHTLRSRYAKLEKRYPVDAFRTMDSYFAGLPQPDYADIPSLPYHARGSRSPFTITYASKGCPFSCPFCTSARSPVRLRDIPLVIAEVRMLQQRYRLRSINFFDETFTLDRGRTLRLCRRLAKTGVSWTCNTRTELVDQELLEEMREAGCDGISFGIESGDDARLAAMRKARQEQHLAAVRLCRRIGIKTHCSFILGLPGETQASALATLRFARELNPHSGQFNLFVPYPGTVYGDAAENNRDEGSACAAQDWRQDVRRRSDCALSAKALSALRSQAYRGLFLSPRWLASNALHVARHPLDFQVACKYFFGAASDCLLHRMEHGH